MNIVSKFYYSLLVFMSFTFVNVSVSAENCGKLTFVGDKDLLAKHQLMLAWNSSFFKVKNENVKEEGLGQYKVLAQKYLFLLKENNSQNISNIHNNTFQVDVKRDFNYILNVMNNDSTIEVKLIDKKKIECTSTSAKVIKGGGYSNAIKNRPKPLPEYLKTKLNRFMAKLDNYTDENNMSNEGVIVYQGKPNQLGIIADKKYQQQHKLIKILTITPFSLANRLGLKSGDVIHSLGEDKNVGTIDLITQHISSLYDGEKINIAVERDSKLIMLNPLKNSVMNKRNIYSMTYKLITDTNSEK